MMRTAIVLFMFVAIGATKAGAVTWAEAAAKCDLYPPQAVEACRCIFEHMPVSVERYMELMEDAARRKLKTPERRFGDDEEFIEKMLASEHEFFRIDGAVARACAGAKGKGSTGARPGP